ncbi:MCE-family protein MCE3A [Mycobacterium vulneris]|uniref:MCE-family protein MCE3A n=1 Tax=Mycolicibacterium vulneris TaxID=547163 RepID=A0A1X2LC35_9MYCO|nr:MCE family protein [Mycolicibacterium vulneris]OSC31570.1 MCE-family protein MCE3A [Mycolicibacterium vulneris]
MKSGKIRYGEHRVHAGWWTVGLLTLIGTVLFVAWASFQGTFRSSVPVTLTADRSGLVMETDAKVMLRGVQVGHVTQIDSRNGGAGLKLDIDSDQVRYIPANVEAKIAVTTVFGAKFVDLIPPEHPSPKRLAAGAVLHSSNVTSEVNTVFENVVDLLKMVDPQKLNAVLTAVADGVRGRGQRIGEATTDLNEVLQAVNARSRTLDRDWRSLTDFNKAYDAAAQDITAILDAATTTSATVVSHQKALDSLLLDVVGLSKAGTNLLGPTRNSFITSVNNLEPTTNLLLQYNPEYTCFVQGAAWFLDHGGEQVWGGDGRSTVLDATLQLGNDPYIYPDNLPVVAAKGGPGGKPGCGSLPDPTKNFPVRQMITNTGWGTGVDIRPNPGLGHPCWVDYLPVTRGIPQPVSIRQCIPGPAPGPPGPAPYGAPLYGPGGVPLWPGIPPAPLSPAPPGPGTPP